LILDLLTRQEKGQLIALIDLHRVDEEFCVYSDQVMALVAHGQAFEFGLVQVYDSVVAILGLVLAILNHVAVVVG
jgi:hypothetical protein